MSLQDAIEDIQSKALALGMKEAPDYAQEGMNQYPFSITYFVRGPLIGEAGWVKGLHTVHCELHFNRAILKKSIEQAAPYIESFPNAIWKDPRLSNTVDTTVSLDYEFGNLEWGDIKNIGWRFIFVLKTQIGIS